MKTKLFASLGASVIVLAAMSATAAAQTAPAANAAVSPPDAEPAGGLETVTVTAQRRSQNLQKVPLAVTAFTSDDLQAQQIVNTIDLSSQVPNMFSANNVGQASANVYYIRGLGQTQSFPTFEPQVGTYVDDIYIARQNANNFALFGVQQLQVLNGPQGTLFGRNSTGGAIVVTMKKPGESFGGDAQIKYGSFGGVTGQIGVDMPISDEVLTRTSAYGISQNGYVTDVTTGEKLNSVHNFGFREAVTVLPQNMSNLTWNISADYERNDSANLLNQPDANGSRISYSGFTQEGGALEPFLTGEKASFGQGAVVTTFGLASNIAIAFDAGTLNIITGYRGLHQNLAADFPAASLGDLPTGDAIPTGEITLAQRLRSYQVSQEAKWTGDIGSDFTYTAGVFYLFENNKNDYGQVLGLSPTLAFALNDQLEKNSTHSEAVYAQGDYKVTDALTLTLGGRLTNETKDADLAPNQPGLGYTTDDVEAAGYPTHLHTLQFTPRVALQYQVDDSLMLFASATRGFQGGGWNGLTGSNPIDFNDFGPESIWSYEGGFRYQSPDDTLRLNATAFYENVRNYQLLSDNPFTDSFDTSNAADMFAYGLEANITWRPIDALTLSANAATIKAAYFNPSSLIQAQQARCLAGIPGNCDSGIVRSDGQLATPVYTPPFQITGNANYVFDFGDFTLTPNISVEFVAREWFDTANTPGIAATYPDVGGQNKARTLLNLGVTFEPTQLPLSVTAECSNCTKVDYGTADLLGLDYFNAPGTWDVRVGYKF